MKRIKMTLLVLLMMVTPVFNVFTINAATTEAATEVTTEIEEAAAASPSDAVFNTDGLTNTPTAGIDHTINDIYIELLILIILFTLWLIWNVFRVAIRFAISQKL